jgi:hypothetical protein
MGNLKQFQGKSTVDLIVEYHKKRGDFVRPVFRTSVAVSIGSSRQAT